MKQVNFRLSPSEISEFQALMRKGHVYSGIHGIIMRDFTIGFELICRSKEKSLDWFIEVMNIFPNLERLREFRIAPNTYWPLRSVEQKMVNYVLQLKNIKEIAYEFDHYLELLMSFAKRRKELKIS